MPVLILLSQFRDLDLLFIRLILDLLFLDLSHLRRLLNHLETCLKLLSLLELPILIFVILPIIILVLLVLILILLIIPILILVLLIIPILVLIFVLVLILFLILILLVVLILILVVLILLVVLVLLIVLVLLVLLILRRLLHVSRVLLNVGILQTRWGQLPRHVRDRLPILLLCNNVAGVRPMINQVLQSKGYVPSLLRDLLNLNVVLLAVRNVNRIVVDNRQGKVLRRNLSMISVNLLVTLLFRIPITPTRVLPIHLNQDLRERNRRTRRYRYVCLAFRLF